MILKWALAPELSGRKAANRRVSEWEVTSARRKECERRRARQKTAQRGPVVREPWVTATKRIQHHSAEGQPSPQEPQNRRLLGTPIPRSVAKHTSINAFVLSAPRTALRFGLRWEGENTFSPEFTTA